MIYKLFVKLMNRYNKEHENDFSKIVQENLGKYVDDAFDKFFH